MYVVTHYNPITVQSQYWVCTKDWQPIVSGYDTDAVCFWQETTEEIWKEAVHAAAAIHDKGSLLALWQRLALNQHHWNAPSGAAQVMSAHVLATSKPKQGYLCPALSQTTAALSTATRILPTHMLICCWLHRFLLQHVTLSGVAEPAVFPLLCAAIMHSAVFCTAM